MPSIARSVRSADPVFVRVFRGPAGGGARMVVLSPGASVDATEMSEIARRTESVRAVMILPPRREDCTSRLRVWSTEREIPFSVGAVLAAATVMEGSGTASFEVGVLRIPYAGASTPMGPGWRVDLPRTVVGGPLDHSAPVAEALGLLPDDLHPTLPVVAASAGLGYLLVPVTSPVALVRARIDASIWPRVVEKARVVGVMAFMPPEGSHVQCASLAFGDGKAGGWATGSACGPLAVYLRRHAGSTEATVTFELKGPDGSHATVFGSVEGDGEGEGAVKIAGTASVEAIT